MDLLRATGSGLAHAGSTVRDRLMPVPSAMQGLLTDDDIANARRQGLLGMSASLLDSGSGSNGQPAPGLGAAIGRGLQAGMGGFQQTLGGTAENNVQMMGLAKHQQMEQQRNAIAQKYAITPNDPPDAIANKLRAMFSEFVRLGDTEMVGKLSQVMPSIMAGSKKSLLRDDLGDRVRYLDPETGAVVREDPKGLSPRTPTDITTENRFQSDQRNKILDDFARDGKSFQQVMGGWEVLKGATKDPSLATKFAITDAYARITNPGAIVRPTTMEMIDQMGSLGQRMKKAWEHSTTGELPASIVQDFQRTLYNIVLEHKAQFDQIRQKAIKRAKLSGINDIDQLLEDYTVDNPLATPTAAPNGAAPKASAQVRSFLK